jgi:hypothetical protein
LPSVTKFWSLLRISLSASYGFRPRSVWNHNRACSNGSAQVPLPLLARPVCRSLAFMVGARPCVSRHRSKSASVLISRLTLPSSGPAYGGPLKSNVRPQNFTLVG